MDLWVLFVPSYQRNSHALIITSTTNKMSAKIGNALAESITPIIWKMFAKNPFNAGFSKDIKIEQHPKTSEIQPVILPILIREP